MNLRQITFLLMAILAWIFEFTFETTAFATSVIPGWHFSQPIYVSLDRVSVGLSLAFIGFLYGWIPASAIKNWHFVLHASFSIIPLILFTAPDYFLSLTMTDEYDPDNLAWQINGVYSFQQGMTLLFIANQILFVVALTMEQFRLRKGQG